MAKDRSKKWVWGEGEFTLEATEQQEKTAKSFIEVIEKFNPYHDNKGRFTTAGGAASFTIRTKDPAKQKRADMAVARAKVSNANALDKIGGQGAKSVKAALSEGAKWDTDTQQKVATRLNQSKITDFTSDWNDGRYHFRLDGYDDKGSSMTSTPKKEWYSYETALAIAAYGTLQRSPNVRR